MEGDVWELFETKALDHDVPARTVVLTILAAVARRSKNTVISNDELGRKPPHNNAQRPKFAFMNPGAHPHAASLPDSRSYRHVRHLLERFFDDVGFTVP